MTARESAQLSNTVSKAHLKRGNIFHIFHLYHPPGTSFVELIIREPLENIARRLCCSSKSWGSKGVLEQFPVGRASSILKHFADGSGGGKSTHTVFLSQSTEPKIKFRSADSLLIQVKNESTEMNKNSPVDLFF